MELSDLALELEKASKNADKAFVNGNHGRFMEEYEAMKKALETIVS